MRLLPAHNRPARPVESYEEIEALLPELERFIDDHNGRFRGTYDTAYAIAHGQVSMEPLALSVICREYVEGTHSPDVPKELRFRSRFIINPRIVHIPEKALKQVEQENPITESFEKRAVSVPNKYRVEEACMSFPHKKAKKVDRFYEVKVEYQIPAKGLMGGMKLKTIRETVTGLKAHIFQHEIDHMQGKNIFYGNRVR